MNTSPAPTPPLDERSLALRRLVTRALQRSGRGHPGPALSVMEILRVLFDEVLRYDPRQPRWPLRDRFILSKGHGCLGLYALLADKGFISVELLDGFCDLESPIGGHPELGRIPGVEASTGALGHGLPMGAGMALAARLRRQDHRVFVLMGDGEIDEGSVWEAAMFATKHRLDNLVALVDYNKLQSYGRVSEVLELEPLADKWTAFGFSVREVDGHDLQALGQVLRALPFTPGRPSLVLCHTIKGRGIPEMENNPEWHHKNRLVADDLAAMHRALEGR
ncbi:MAG: transketolase [Magnetococcales bacterium]|nr:transketolase [Magnetococcales bacterium]